MSESFWSVSPMALAAFVAMAAVTFGMRAGGFWLMGRVPMTERMRKGLEALPGALIVATILPVALARGVPASVCLLATALTMAVVRRDFVAVIAGLAVAALLRHLGY